MGRTYTGPAGRHRRPQRCGVRRPAMKKARRGSRWDGRGLRPRGDSSPRRLLSLGARIAVLAPSMAPRLAPVALSVVATPPLRRAGLLPPDARERVKGQQPRDAVMMRILP
jgi:hypothetical protein